MRTMSPHLLPPAIKRKSNKRSREKQTVLLPNVPVIKRFESWLLWCQLKAEKMTVSRKCSNVQTYITLEEFNEGVIFRIWLIRVQLYPVWQEDSQGGFIKVNVTVHLECRVLIAQGRHHSPLFWACLGAPPGSISLSPSLAEHTICKH